jgi:hypothetical protein
MVGEWSWARRALETTRIYISGAEGEEVEAMRG